MLLQLVATTHQQLHDKVQPDIGVIIRMHVVRVFALLLQRFEAPEGLQRV